MNVPAYDVLEARVPPELACLWDGPSWRSVPDLAVARFHPKGSDHRPVTRAKLQHDLDRLYALWQVQDRFVRSVHTAYDSDTYKDSCVELFLRPGETGGYFALEVNCGGAYSLRYIEDWTRTANRFARWSPVPAGLAAAIRVAHSLPTVTDPEMTGPLTWLVELAIPFDLLESFAGPLRPLPGCTWGANVFKCGDETSHPHWGSWAPIGEALNFHQPQYFGTLRFAGAAT